VRGESLASTCKPGEEILAEVREPFPPWRVRSRSAYTSDSGDEGGWCVDKSEGKHRYAYR
jgi:hypothetical protein